MSEVSMYKCEGCHEVTVSGRIRYNGKPMCVQCHSEAVMRERYPEMCNDDK